jgi:Cof subfamily protein (haloacid dehalogenase superfamily)
MKYRLIALDLDGTLLDSRLQIRSQTVDALQRARRNGLQVMIVTGRHHTAAYPYWHQLDLELPAICCNGTYLYDFRHRRPLAGDPLTLAESNELLALVRKHAIHAMVYVDDVMAYETQSPHLRNLLKWSATLPENVRPRIEPVDSFEKLIERADMRWKFLVAGDNAKALEDFNEEVSQRLQLSCVRSAHNRIDISHGGNNKGARLAEFIAQQGILPQEVIAFGDQDNDKEMLRLVGLGVAMGNSHEAVRDHADWVTGTNDSDAIADVLHRFVLSTEVDC